MLLPIRTNIYPRRTPYTNYALIIINVIIFFLTYGPHKEIWGDHLIIVPVHHWAKQFMLTPNKWQWWQFVTYAFLHGGYMHIIGNMFFLYLFGNNVNDKIGHIGYLGFYLAGAILSGIGHAAANSSSYVSTLGASGAVAAVTGAYLVLFPQTIITVLYWFFFIGTWDLPALYFIAFKLVIWDNIIEPRFAPGPIAYSAHLAGYAFGIAAILALLASGLLSSSNFDLWAMVKRWNRRRQYRDAVSGGYDPFTGPIGRKPIKVKEVKNTSSTVSGNEDKITELRNEIANRLAQRNPPAAADAYLELMKLDSNLVLPRQHLLDIANQLASDKRTAEAVQPYEQFLTHYSSYEYAEQVELMLGLLYARYLHQPEKAIKHLTAAAEKLSDPGQLKMCKDELARLQA
jgi:membrane associated rhomboid family serine protease